VSVYAWTDPRHPWMSSGTALVLDVAGPEDDDPGRDLCDRRACLYCGGKLVGVQLRYCCYAHRDRDGHARRAAQRRATEPR
jgi:hypothetical protein